MISSVVGLLNVSSARSSADNPKLIEGFPETTVNPFKTRLVILYLAAGIVLLALKSTPTCSPLQTSIT